MKPTDKIEVEVGDLRHLVGIIHDEGFDCEAMKMKAKYPAAFAPDEEWEDVTKMSLNEIFRHSAGFKIENNRIWRRR